MSWQQKPEQKNVWLASLGPCALTRSATTHRNRAGEHGEAGVNSALVGAEQLGPHEVAGGAVEEHAARVGAQVGRVDAELGDGRPRRRRRAAHEDGGLGAWEDALCGEEGGAKGQ